MAFPHWVGPGQDRIMSQVATAVGNGSTNLDLKSCKAFHQLEIYKPLLPYCVSPAPGMDFPSCQGAK